MTDKIPYLERFKELHRQKTGEELSDAEVLDYFEQLVALVEAVYE